jgi:hypothetical protein
MATFDCNYETLRSVAGEFIKAIPTANADELEAGMSCFQLHYLGLETEVDHERSGATALFHIISREYILAEAALG